MKKSYFILILLLILLPMFVYAKEDSLLYEKLYTILGEDGKLKIDTIQSLDNAHLSSSNVEESYDVEFSRVISSYIYGLKEVRELLNEYEDENPFISVFCKSYTDCGITIHYDSDARGIIDGDYPDGSMKHYDVEIGIVKEVDEESYEMLKDKFLDEKQKDFYLYDLAYINQLYHQNSGNVNFINQLIASPTTIARNFPEINDILTDYPDFDTRYAMWSNMGSGSNYVEYKKSADYILYYKNIAYLHSTFVFRIAPVLFVDDTVSDDELIDAATKRIKNYINNDDIKIVIDDVTPKLTDEEINSIHEELNDFLKASVHINYSESSRIYSLKIGATESVNHFYIVKTSKEHIKDLEIKAIEKSTGIRFTSSSISIPIDSTFVISDVTSQYKELNESVELAYDINLYSDSTGAYVKSVVGGMKIYIPVENSFAINDKKIAYLDNDGQIQEKFDLSIETINGQRYITFVTDHLSVYGLVSESVDGLIDDNPKTGVNMLIFYLLGVVCIVVVVFNKKIFMNKKKN